MPSSSPLYSNTAGGVSAPGWALRVALGLGALLLLPACKSWRIEDCKKPQLYEQSQSVPALRVPVGLDPLNNRGALQIPELRSPEKPRSASDPCLDVPPKYSNANLLPLARDKKAIKAQEKAAKAAAAEAKAKAKTDKAAQRAKKPATAAQSPDTAAAPAADKVPAQ